MDIGFPLPSLTRLPTGACNLSPGGRAASSGCPATGVLIVCTGETVDGHLQVTAIDAASVKLQDPSTSQETTLLLAKFTEGPS